jgi:hypothetical protein
MHVAADLLSFVVIQMETCTMAPVGNGDTGGDGDGGDGNRTFSGHPLTCKYFAGCAVWC